MSHNGLKTRERRLREGDEPATVTTARWEIKLVASTSARRSTTSARPEPVRGGRPRRNDSTQVSKLELGDTVTTLPLLARLAKALGTTLNSP
ncbi:hypothetical protein ABH926_010108 [Catenulispora sp. GP43]|uniref:transcriptional regulator n=1 Tax=Catenulispora sp. GP43 TaxID=3156263 RepID=UPI0035175A6F